MCLKGERRVAFAHSIYSALKILILSSEDGTNDQEPNVFLEMNGPNLIQSISISSQDSHIKMLENYQKHLEKANKT